MASLMNPSSFSHDDLTQLFNLQNDMIETLDVKHTSSSVEVYITLQRDVHECPVCGSKTNKVKAYTTKKILHSLLTNYPCYIIYRARRYVCEVCHKTFYEHNPFTHGNMKISVVTVSNVLQDLKKVTETFTSVAERYNLTPTTAAFIFDSHVSVSRKILPKYLCIDECYAFSGVHGDYVCVLFDFLSTDTIDLLPSRKKQDLIRYFERIPLEERKRVQMVCIDMWETYRMVSKRMFPNCRVAVDKFHILQDLHRKVKKIRTRVMMANSVKHKSKKQLLEATRRNDKEARIEYDDFLRRDTTYYLLKKFDWLLFINYESKKTLLDSNKEKRKNRKLNRYLNLKDILNLILDSDEELKEAYYFLDDFDHFYRTSNTKNSKARLERLIERAGSSSISELIEFGNTIIRWKNEILNSFIIVDTVIDEDGVVTERKINNGIAENKNRNLKILKNNSNGYRNWERFRNRGLYVLNKDATYHLNPLEGK